jgi:Creatinine amidohydrolase
VYYSFNEHHMDFPGTIAVKGQTIINYVTDIGRSLAHHGFRKILLVNGHGSNVPFLDVAARNITNRTEAICAMASWWSLIPKPLLHELRESEYPGGMAHGEGRKRYQLPSHGILLLGSRRALADLLSRMVQPLFADRHGGRSN